MGAPMAFFCPYSSFPKGEITPFQKVLLRLSKKALLRLSKRRYYGFPKGVLTPFLDERPFHFALLRLFSCYYVF